MRSRLFVNLTATVQLFIKTFYGAVQLNQLERPQCAPNQISLSLPSSYFFHSADLARADVRTVDV